MTKIYIQAVGGETWNVYTADKSGRTKKKFVGSVEAETQEDAEESARELTKQPRAKVEEFL